MLQAAVWVFAAAAELCMQVLAVRSGGMGMQSCQQCCRWSMCAAAVWVCATAAEHRLYLLSLSRAVR